MIISNNMVLSPGSEPTVITRPCRIIDVDESSGSILLISLETDLKKPWTLNIENILDEISSGHLRIAPEHPPEFMMRLEEELHDREKASREESWRVIRDLVENRGAGELFVDGEFGKIVASHAEKMGVGRKRVYSLLYRYWAYGHSKNAFLWQSTKCGAPGIRKNYAPGVIPGRPPKYRGLVIEDRAVRINPFHMLCIETAFQRYKNRLESSKKSAFDWMLNHYYRSVLSDGKPGDIERGAHPTYDQFVYYAENYFSPLDILKGRGGMIRWNKDYRPLKGTAIDGLIGPCHRYEIDATIADIYLVHRVNRNWLIGRPVLYVVVDAYSRMIVGIHVGLEGPSWEGARHALYNAFTSKVAYCKRYGVDITEELWPCSGVPIEVSADRAELLSNAGEEVSNTLGLILKIAPPFRPDWKAIVESRFKLINEGLNLKFIPGGVDARRLERGDRDSQLDAILDIDKFTEMIIYYVLQHNRELHLPDLATNQMIEDEIDLNPLSIWEWAMKSNPLKLNVRSDAELKISLLPTVDATVRRGGILFKGVLYTCQLAEQEQWFALSHNISLRRVKVWYDPNSVDNVWIKDGRNFLPLKIVQHQLDKFSGFRLEEIEDRLAAIRHLSPDLAYRKLNGAASVKGHADRILKDALDKKNSSPPPISKAEFKKNKREKRRAELEVERAAEVEKLSNIRLADGGNNPEISRSAPSGGAPVSPRKLSILQLVSNSLKGSSNDS